MKGSTFLMRRVGAFYNSSKAKMRVNKKSYSIGALGIVMCIGGVVACTQQNAANQLTKHNEATLQEEKSTLIVDYAPSTVSHEDVLRALQHDLSAVPKKLRVADEVPVYNREAVIPPMCYTKTEGQFNPCYVCHQDQIPGRENEMNDADLQESYSFSDLGTKNHWQNLFEDRAQKVGTISDDEIAAWVNTDNYSILAQRLTNENFQGWIPDLKNLHLAADAFDGEGFAKDGSQWVAFNYKPFPSTFWPTNGSIGDVMIRLPLVFRVDQKDKYSRDIYKTNLAIVEAKIKKLSRITVNNIDENQVAMDLNGDGALTKVNSITYTKDYVGKAKGYLSPPTSYPLGTEFLHTVRYLGVASNGDIYLPPRMKEVRYMKKAYQLTPDAVSESYRQEHYAKQLGELPGYINRGQEGLDNEMGWVLTSFIENHQGELRFNSYEENLFCMGCHSSIGSTVDKTFSFPRKVDGAAGWGYVNLRGMPDSPNVGEREGEILTYLKRAGGGGEFRSNPEMEEKWFDENGNANLKKIAHANDVYDLIMPSAQRAWMLNKAYKAIVSEQDFIYGRDAFVSPPKNVYSAIDNITSPTLPAEKNYKWNIQLDWSALDNGALHAHISK